MDRTSTSRAFRDENWVRTRSKAIRGEGTVLTNTPASRSASRQRLNRRLPNTSKIASNAASRCSGWSRRDSRAARPAPSDSHSARLASLLVRRHAGAEDLRRSGWRTFPRRRRLRGSTPCSRSRPPPDPEAPAGPSDPPAAVSLAAASNDTRPGDRRHLCHRRDEVASATAPPVWRLSIPKTRVPTGRSAASPVASTTPA